MTADTPHTNTSANALDYNSLGAEQATQATEQSRKEKETYCYLEAR